MTEESLREELHALLEREVQCAAEEETACYASRRALANLQSCRLQINDVYKQLDRLHAERVLAARIKAREEAESR